MRAILYQKNTATFAWSACGSVDGLPKESEAAALIGEDLLHEVHLGAGVYKVSYNFIFYSEFLDPLPPLPSLFLFPTASIL